MYALPVWVQCKLPNFVFPSYDILSVMQNMQIHLILVEDN